MRSRKAESENVGIPKEKQSVEKGPNLIQPASQQLCLESQENTWLTREWEKYWPHCGAPSAKPRMKRYLERGLFGGGPGPVGGCDYAGIGPENYRHDIVFKRIVLEIVRCNEWLRGQCSPMSNMYLRLHGLLPIKGEYAYGSSRSCDLYVVPAQVGRHAWWGWPSFSSTTRKKGLNSEEHVGGDCSHQIGAIIWSWTDTRVGKVLGAGWRNILPQVPLHQKGKASELLKPLTVKRSEAK